MDSQISKGDFRPATAANTDLTEQIVQAVETQQVRVIPNACIYSTDRPNNQNHHGFIGPNGNSEVEVGHSFRVEHVIAKMNIEPTQARLSMNSIRIYGPIPRSKVLHYHGFSKQNLERLAGSAQLILLIVHSLGTYEEDGSMSVSDERGTLESTESRTALIHEDEDILKASPLNIGDMVAVPSGVSHTFAAVENVWASYSVIEIASHSEVMYQTHWLEEEGEGSRIQQLLANSLRLESDSKVVSDRLLDLYDIPAFRPYIRG